MSSDNHQPSAARSVDMRKAAEAQSLNRVQRRVAAIGFFAIAVHGVIGLVVIALMKEGDGRHGDAVGLSIMSVVVAFVTYAVIRIILGAKLWSPAWLVVALGPSTAAVIWILTR